MKLFTTSIIAYFIFVAAAMAQGLPPQVKLASLATGVDCGDKVNHAAIDLASTGGEVWLAGDCPGLTIATRVTLPDNVYLRFLDCAHFTVTAPWDLSIGQINIGSNGGLIGNRCASLKVGDGVNPQIFIHAPPTAVHWKVTGMILDGNRANNPGPYTLGNAMIWAGDNTGSGQNMQAEVAHNIFQNTAWAGLFEDHVGGITTSDNDGVNIGRNLVHLSGTFGGASSDNNHITLNRTDYSNASVAVPMIATDGSVDITSSGGFDTRWGTPGFPGFVTVMTNQPGTYLFDSCPSGSLCHLKVPFLGASGNYIGLVDSGFAIYLQGGSHNEVALNTIRGTDSAAEAINVSVGDYNTIVNNDLSWPDPHTAGAEGITIGNEVGGGNANYNLISGNWCLRPYTVCVLINPINYKSGEIVGNVITDNIIIDASGSTFNGGPLWDAGIRIAGSIIDSTTVNGNTCISTRTGLANPRNGFNFCIAVDAPLSPVKNTIIGINWFKVADDRGIWDIVRDNGVGTTFLGF